MGSCCRWRFITRLRCPVVPRHRFAHSVRLRLLNYQRYRQRGEGLNHCTTSLLMASKRARPTESRLSNARLRQHTPHPGRGHVRCGEPQRRLGVVLGSHRARPHGRLFVRAADRRTAAPSSPPRHRPRPRRFPNAAPRPHPTLALSRRALPRPGSEIPNQAAEKLVLAAVDRKEPSVAVAVWAASPGAHRGGLSLALNGTQTRVLLRNVGLKSLWS